MNKNKKKVFKNLWIKTTVILNLKKNYFIYSDCVNKTKKCLIKNEWIKTTEILNLMTFL